MKAVPLGGRKAAGRVALVDDGDYELVMRHRWHVQEDTRPGRRSSPYARAEGPGGRPVFMHVLIAGYPKPDHVDGNGLNNQRSNLRPSTAAQNDMNRRKREGTTSRYKGVNWHAGSAKWQARITHGGRVHSLGRHVSEEAAAAAYDAAASELFGEYARLNFPEEADAA